MNPIDALFARLRAEKRKAFVPFLTAGDPDLETSRLLVEEVARRGASLVEIGFPYSDPIADGAVIQASYTRALGRGLKIDQVFDLTRSLAQSEPFRSGATPLVGMISYSLVHHRGPEAFVTTAKSAGLSGAIVPDLPVDESSGLVDIARAHGFKLIHLVTPTTPPARAERIAKATTGFLYCVSVVGITGERSQMPPELIGQLREMRTKTPLPLCVGFGISTPEQVRLLRDHADGVIVGSALVRRLGEKLPRETLVREIGDQVASLAAALAG